MTPNDWLMSNRTIILAAVAIALLAVVGIASGWYAKSRASRAPAGRWNPSAIDSAFAGMRVQQVDASSSNVIFLYDLENHSGSDYTLNSTPSLIIMGRLKSTGSLSPEPQYHLASSVFLPANNRVRITLETTQPFHWPTQMDAAAEAQFRAMVGRTVNDLAGFVLFDPETHYQIELPGSWPAAADTANLLNPK